MSTSSNVASVDLPVLDLSQRDRIAATVSEISAEAVRLSNDGSFLVDTVYTASVDGFCLKVCHAAPSQKQDDEKHHILFDQHLNLRGYSENPDDIHKAERDAIVVLNNWLGYLSQL